MRLGIDLDGVVANFTKGWIEFYNREFGASIESANAWGDMVDLTHFRDMDEFWAWTADLDGHSLFWHLEPFDGAVASLQELDRDGHDVVILTFKPDFAIEDTFDWIERHGVPNGEIHILEDKWLIDCDVYLDDGPQVLAGLVEHRPEKTVCRYVRPWNNPIDGATDIHDFAEFRDLVNRLASQD